MAELKDGFADLANLLPDLAKMADLDTIRRAQEAAAKPFVQAMRRRSSPRGRSSPHMLDRIGYQWDGKGNTVVGWQDFYGRLKESGHKTVLGYKRKKTKSTKKAYAVTASTAHKKAQTRFVNPRRHMQPEFEAQKEDMIRRMVAVYQGGS